MLLRYSPYTLHLKRTFTLASGSRTTTPAVLVEVEAEGIVGYGEASLPPYLDENPESVGTFLAKVEPRVCHSVVELDRLLAEIDRISTGDHAAKAAVDIALHDWLGKSLGWAWHRILGLDPQSMPLTSYTIGMGDPDFIRSSVKDAKGFKVLKVKFGGDSDREIIETIRSLTEIPVRVDVNGGWRDRSEALAFIEWLAKQNVELVEQPFPKDRIDDTAWLRERSPLPVIADESVARLGDLGRLHGVFDGVNIKLMKCTGLREAHQMIAAARTMGMKVMLGCMTETSCAISAAVQLAPLADWADLDGALLISNDPFVGATVREGRLVMPDGAGIGVVKKSRP